MTDSITAYFSEFNHVIEFVSMVTGFLFLILLMRQHIGCWFFGIISSILATYLFIDGKLYSEAILYGFYVLAGVYGWIKWSSTGRSSPLRLQKLALTKHVLWIGIGLISAFILGKLFDIFTDADKTYIDATTTSFSFIATFLEAHKYVYAWIYWIAINGVTIWLYYTKEFNLLSFQMLVYMVLSVAGLFAWQRQWKSQLRNS